MIEDAELNFPDDADEDDAGTKRTGKYHKKGKYTVDTNKEFKFARESTDARMIVKGGNRYIVLAGSIKADYRRIHYYKYSKII